MKANYKLFYFILFLSCNLLKANDISSCYLCVNHLNTILDFIDTKKISLSTTSKDISQNNIYPSIYKNLFPLNISKNNFISTESYNEIFSQYKNFNENKVIYSDHFINNILKNNISIDQDSFRDDLMINGSTYINSNRFLSTFASNTVFNTSKYITLIAPNIIPTTFNSSQGNMSDDKWNQYLLTSWRTYSEQSFAASSIYGIIEESKHITLSINPNILSSIDQLKVKNYFVVNNLSSLLLNIIQIGVDTTLKQLKLYLSTNKQLNTIVQNNNSTLWEDYINNIDDKGATIAKINQLSIMQNELYTKYMKNEKKLFMLTIHQVQRLQGIINHHKNAASIQSTQIGKN